MLSRVKCLNLMHDYCVCSQKLSLAVDGHGLWLCANGMKMQPDWGAEIPRLKRANPKSELIARACQTQ